MKNSFENMDQEYEQNVKNAKILLYIKENISDTIASIVELIAVCDWREMQCLG